MVRFFASCFLVLCFFVSGWAAAQTELASVGPREIEDAYARLAEKVLPTFVFVGGGSGVLISPEGDILTNFHVAGGSERWRVRLAIGKTYVAHAVGHDPIGDLSLLRIEGASGLPYAVLADSDRAEVGDIVLALGNPFMLGSLDDKPTATFGIVSGMHLYQGNYSDALQTDAPINPGNSGGPLFNRKGELLGINGKIQTRFGQRTNTGIGYAIPANQIRRFLEPLRTGGYASHGTIRGLRVATHTTGGMGAVVTEVEPSSSAFQAGFRVGDWIKQIDGLTVGGFRRLRGILGSYPGGTRVRVKVLRERDFQEFDVVLDAVRPRQPHPSEMPFLGIRFRPERPSGGGAQVAGVVDGAPAQKAEILPGDVLVQIGESRVSSPAAIQRILQKFKPGQAIAVRITREGQPIDLELTLERRGNR